MDFRAKIVKIVFAIVTCTFLSTVTAETDNFELQGNGILFHELSNRMERLEARESMRENENRELNQRVLYLESLTKQQQIEIKNMNEVVNVQKGLNQKLQARLHYLEGRDRIMDSTETDLKYQKKRIQSLEWFIRKLTRNNPNRRESQVSTERDTDGQALRNIKKKDSGIQMVNKRENEVTVAFFATLNNKIQNPGVHQIIAFDHVTTNLGNGYNPHAGDFRAPVAGTYVFATTLMADYSSVTYHFKIMHNANAVSNIYIVNGGTSSQEVVLQLNQGDDVSIHNMDAGKSIYGYNYSTFSGFLLQQDFSSSTVVGK